MIVWLVWGSPGGGADLERDTVEGQGLGVVGAITN